MPFDDERHWISDKERFDRSKNEPPIREVRRSTQPSGRDARRINKFGRFTERPWRSRIMRGVSMDPRTYDDDGRRILPSMRFLGIKPIVPSEPQ